MTHPEPSDRLTPQPAHPRIVSAVGSGTSSILAAVVAASGGPGARPGGRRGGARGAWPTAPTTTHTSPAGVRRGRSHGKPSTPTPASVWTCGQVAIDLDATWPAPLIERVVTAFSTPGAHVALLDWPTPHHTRPTLTTVGQDGVLDPTPNTRLATSSGGSAGVVDAGLADAVTLVRRLQRTVVVEHLPVDPTDTGTASRPFWADLINGGGPAPTTATTVTTSTPASAPASTVDRVDTGAGRTVAGADLVITSVAPHRFAHDARDDGGDGRGDRSADLVALYAARLLRVGGTLVVLTHCDWSGGELTDPTGTVVTAAQNADLLYLQHIVAVHAPIRDGRFDPDLHPDSSPDATRFADVLTVTPGADDTRADSVHAGVKDRLAHGVDKGRGRDPEVMHAGPAPHQRIHSDVLVFGQPHDHRPAIAPGSSEATGHGDR